MIKKLNKIILYAAISISIFFNIQYSIYVNRLRKDFTENHSHLVVPFRNNDGYDLNYHLCRLNTKKGIVLGEENFNKNDEAWVVCGISNKYSFKYGSLEKQSKRK